MKSVTLTIAAALATVGLPVTAQDLGASKSAADIVIHSFDAEAGSAIIADRLGEKYVCGIAEKQAWAEIGSCKPIRLSKRVGGYIEAQGQVLALFERNDCTLTYSELKSALTNASDDTRVAVGEIMSDMTQSGALIDDETRGRAQLTTGSVCSK